MHATHASLADKLQKRQILTRTSGYLTRDLSAKYLRQSDIFCRLLFLWKCCPVENALLFFETITCTPTFFN